MARRSRGKDSPARTMRARDRVRPREVYVFSEGEVTEKTYIDIIHECGTPADPSRPTEVLHRNETAPSKRRKPLTLVEEAVSLVGEVERAAKRAGLRETDWNWPQVWCLFDRDQHEQIPTAFAKARRAGVRIAYSHPCFELWRLFHYQDYTATFGGVCDLAANRLKGRPGFAQTYGEGVKAVSTERAKRVMPDQVLTRYAKAAKYARQINERHNGPDPTTWDPYTDVWRFVEDGLGLADY